MAKRKKTPEVADGSVPETPQSVPEDVPQLPQLPQPPRLRMSGDELKGLQRQQRRETRLKERGY